MKGKRKRRVYFAHSKLDYGTKGAKAARALIARLRPKAKIVDPSQTEANFEWELNARFAAGARDTRAAYDAIYRDRIGAADEVAVLEWKGAVGRGVFNEVRFALKRGLPCSVIRDGRLQPISAVKNLDPDDWTYFFGRVVVRRGAARPPRVQAAAR